VGQSTCMNLSTGTIDSYDTRRENLHPALYEAQHRTLTVQMRAADTQLCIDKIANHPQQRQWHGWPCGHDLIHAYSRQPFRNHTTPRQRIVLKLAIQRFPRRIHELLWLYTLRHEIRDRLSCGHFNSLRSLLVQRITHLDHELCALLSMWHVRCKRLIEQRADYLARAASPHHNSSGGTITCTSMHSGNSLRQRNELQTTVLELFCMLAQRTPTFVAREKI
jgi:hypothetical protein